VRHVGTDAAGRLAALVVGDARDVETLARGAARPRKRRLHAAPALLAPDAAEDEASHRCAPRGASPMTRAPPTAAIAALHAKHDVGRALADADRLHG
jgi:hypothetical protein